MTALPRLAPRMRAKPKLDRHHALGHEADDQQDHGKAGGREHGPAPRPTRTPKIGALLMNCENLRQQRRIAHRLCCIGDEVQAKQRNAEADNRATQIAYLRILEFVEHHPADDDQQRRDPTHL